MEKLEQLQPIVTTVKAQDIAETPELVRNNYEFVASVFYAFESVQRQLRDPILRRLSSGKPMLGYVSGEYGYGKTATMIWLWHQCEREGIIAVPPFLFYSWDDMLLATTKWLAHRLKEKRPDVARDAESLYERFRGKAVDELANDVARRQRVSREEARRIVEDLLRQGRLSLMSAPQMADFLKEGSDFARAGGFKGLVVFADEVQNFVDQPNGHERIEQMRMFVHAFRALDCPAGMFWGLPNRIEERLFEQAGDMIQRIQDYGAFLNLQDAYTRDFPKSLWEQLCRTYAPEAKEIVDEAALEALGQICERKDLSNGPRTVIAAFRSIAYHWREKRKQYTAWELANDYEQGRIVFEGQGQKITTTMRTLLNEPIVRDNPDFQRAIRFLCMFPEGVHRKVAERYGVWKEIDTLANAWGFLGTHIYEPSHNHLALAALRRTGVTLDVLTALLHRFRNKWWHDTPEHWKWQVAKIAFVRFILPELFPKRSAGEQTKWIGHPREGEEEEIARMRVASVLLEGSFEGTQHLFPERKLAVAVSEREEDLSRWQPRSDDVDLVMRFFLLEQPEDIVGEVVTTRGEPIVDFRLNLNRHYDEYPSDLHVFRDIMSPHHCTAMVLLNLTMFIYAEISHRETPDHDKQLLQTNLMRPAIRHILALLLPDKLQGVGITVKGAGETLVENIFAQKCSELYPDYKPLVTGRQSENDLKRYQTVLLKGGLTGSEKQGTRAKIMPREELAKVFDIAASQLDAVVNRLENMELLKVREMRTLEGRRVEVTFTEHPLERKMREWVREFGSDTKVRVGGRTKTVKQIGRDELVKLARKWGAHEKEITFALELAKTRGSLDYDETKVREAVAEINPDEIRGEAERIWRLIEPLRVHFPDDVRRHETALNQIVAKTYTEDETQWDEARYELSQTIGTLREFVRQKAEQIAKEAKQHADALHSARVQLPMRELERKVELSLRLAEWLDDQRRQLLKETQRLASDLQRAAADFERIESRTERLRTMDEFSTALKELAEISEQLRKTLAEIGTLKERVSRLESLLKGLDGWRAVASEADELRTKIPDRYADLRQQLDDWIERVMEHFAEHRQDALKDHEQFDYELREIKANLSKRAQDEANEFNRLAQEYERLLRGITDSRLSTRYSADDPEGSYERLVDEVMQKLLNAIGELGARLQHDQARATFLRVIRQRDTSELDKALEELDKEWQRLGREINREVVKSFRDGDKRLNEICQVMHRWISKRGEVQKKLSEVDKPLQLEEDEETLLKLVREVAQRQRVSGSVSLAHVWEAAVTDRKLKPERLLALVEQLYRKGWIDISLSERK